LLLTDDKRNLGEMFEVGKEIVTYQDAAEAAAHVRYYADHPDEAEAIARAGQARTLRDHSYARRMEELRELLSARLRA
jgi:spore maturation protein CgeB